MKMTALLTGMRVMVCRSHRKLTRRPACRQQLKLEPAAKLLSELTRLSAQLAEHTYQAVVQAQEAASTARWLHRRMAATSRHRHQAGRSSKNAMPFMPSTNARCSV